MLYVGYKARRKIQIERKKKQGAIIGKVRGTINRKAKRGMPKENRTQRVQISRPAEGNRIVGVTFRRFGCYGYRTPWPLYRIYYYYTCRSVATAANGMLSRDSRSCPRVHAATDSELWSPPQSRRRSKPYICNIEPNN
jgi:hypothetical protein